MLECVLGGADFTRTRLPSCWGLRLQLAGYFGKELEGETGSGLPVTDASFAVACLAAFNAIGPIQAIFTDAVFVSIIVLILVEVAE